MDGECAMNTTPDLPEVPSFSEVQSMSEIKPLREVGVEGQPEPQQSENNFRKQLREAMEIMLHRHEGQGFSFSVILLDGDLIVEVLDSTGELLLRMPGQEFIDRSKGSDISPFFVDCEC